MKIFLLSLCLACASMAQNSNVKISQQAADDAFTVITHYTPGGNPDYVCKARSTQDISTITVSAISNANPGVMTATAHGLYFATGVSQKLSVFISGLTGNWTPLNGIHVLSTASANSLTTDVNTTTFGAVTGAIVVSTRAPKVTANIWTVQVTVYDASSLPTIVSWAAPTTLLNGSPITQLGQLSGGMTSPRFPCALPTSYQ